MPATFNKFNNFTYDLIDGIHDFNAHTFKVALTDVAPVATNSQLSHITQTPNGNGYTTGGVPVTPTISTTGGVAKIEFTDADFLASGGDFGDTVKYAVLYNDTSTNDKLIGWLEYPNPAFTLLEGETFKVKFNAAGAITI